MRLTWYTLPFLRSGYIYYLNFRRILEHVDIRASELELGYLTSTTTKITPLYNNIESSIYLERKLMEILQSWDPEIVSIEDLTLQNQGKMIMIERNFRTKNVPLPSDGQAKCQFNGDLNKEPHIYCKINDMKVISLVDPRWITTLTAFAMLKSGHSKFKLLGTIAKVNPRESFVSPLIISA